MANGFKGPNRQRGVSKLGLLIMGIFVALFLTVGLKVGPLYMDNNVLTTLADDLVDDGTANRLEVSEIRQRFADGEIPLPDFWGGYRVVPLSIEFWQGRENRLHDRFRYRRETPDAPWQIERLAP